MNNIFETHAKIVCTDLFSENQIIDLLKFDCVWRRDNIHNFSTRGGNHKSFLYLSLNDIKIQKDTINSFENNAIHFNTNHISCFNEIRKQLDSHVEQLPEYNCEEDDLINNDFLAKCNQTQDIKDLIQCNLISNRIVSYLEGKKNIDELSRSDKDNIKSLISLYNIYPFYVNLFSFRKIVGVDVVIRFGLDEL